jgi:chemotaxis protein CheC
MEISAVLETTNIVCCAYLNSLARILPEDATDGSDLIPSPPRFGHDFAASLIESALMGQVAATDRVLLAETRFQIDGSPVHWTLLFVPDAESMIRLRLLPG